jgi:hypothetical protein
MGVQKTKIRSARALPVLALGLLAMAVCAETCAEAGRDPLVARRMTAFYEVYTGRNLTASEARRVEQEFVVGHARSGMNMDAIRNVAREFGYTLILLREENGHAAALSARHQILELNYFRPDMQGTLELKLMTEPDPVRVTDPRTRRLMTERDVTALANLYQFTKLDDNPRHRELPRARMNELVATLKHSVAANGGTIPQFFGDAAAFWAGVRQHWPYFSPEQKSMARAYAINTWRVSMPVEMYVSLWGLDRRAASSRWTNDVSARIRGGSDALSLQQLRTVMDSAFEP